MVVGPPVVWSCVVPEETVYHLPGFVGGNVNLSRVEVVEIDGAHDTLGYPGGQGDPHPALLAVLGVVGAGAEKMGGVRKVAPVVAGELIPLRQEVVPAAATLGPLFRQAVPT